MRKQFLILPLLLLLGAQVLAKQGDMPSLHPAVLRAFQQDFSGAVNPAWSKAGEYFKVNFAKENTSYSAYYSGIGELVATTRIIFPGQLPLQVIKKLKKHFGLEDVIRAQEYMTGSEPSYYVLHISRGDAVRVVKFDSNGDFEVWKQKRKK